ncbi:hypothetical protein LINPERHAP1_LOCUS12221 [Linum perenne]
MDRNHIAYLGFLQSDSISNKWNGMEWKASERHNYSSTYGSFSNLVEHHDFQILIIVNKCVFDNIYEYVVMFLLEITVSRQ